MRTRTPVGLEREMRRYVTMDMVRCIAKAGAGGRMLVVNATNLDAAGPRVFDLVEEAQRAVDAGELERIHNIMLASAGIPGAFPFRIIDQELYVDGGVTGNILYGGRAEEEEALPAVWQRTYPDVPIPKIRFWIIFNNQFRPVPHVTPPKWMAVVQRSLETATRASTATAVKHLVRWRRSPGSSATPTWKFASCRSPAIGPLRHPGCSSRRP